MLLARHGSGECAPAFLAAARVTVQADRDDARRCQQMMIGEPEAVPGPSAGDEREMKKSV